MTGLSKNYILSDCSPIFYPTHIAVLNHSDPDWLHDFNVTTKGSALCQRYGCVQVTALDYDPVEGVISTPLEKVQNLIQSMGHQLSAPSLLDLLRRLKLSEAVIRLETPWKLSMQFQNNTYNLAKHKVSYINFHIDRTPLLTEPGFCDKLAKLEDLFSDIPKELERSCLHGSARLLSADLIQKVAQYFFSHRSQMRMISLGHEPISYHIIDDTTRLFVLNGPKRLVLFPLFKEHVWEGSYKQVYLSAKLDKDILPASLSKTDDREDFDKEFLFRSKPELSAVLSSTYFTQTIPVEDKNLYYMGCQWANCGTLSSVISPDLRLDYKDQIALDLLSKMDMFHRYAVHKDLHLKNILVDYDGTACRVFINDFGSSELQSNPKNMGCVITMSSNLSPELVQKIGPSRAYKWKAPFDTDLSLEDWIKSEKYTLGMILLQVYLGYNPLKRLVDFKDLKKRFPLYLKTWEEITYWPASKLTLLFSLDKYLNQKIVSEFHKLFVKAHQTMIETPSSNLSSHTELNDDNWKDQRPLLVMYFTQQQRSRFLNLYKLAFDVMVEDLALEMTAEMAKANAGLTHCIVEDIHDEDPLIMQRLEAIKELCSLEPEKRPSFHDVHQKLKIALDNPAT